VIVRHTRVGPDPCHAVVRQEGPKVFQSRRLPSRPCRARPGADLRQGEVTHLIPQVALGFGEEGVHGGILCGDGRGWHLFNTRFGRRRRGCEQSASARGIPLDRHLVLLSTQRQRLRDRNRMFTVRLYPMATGPSERPPNLEVLPLMSRFG